MLNRNQKKTPLVQLVSKAVTNFIRGIRRTVPQKRKGLAGLIDRFREARRKRAEIRAKIATFPPIHQRSSTYKEMVVAYLTGVASTLTCEFVHSSHAYANTIEFVEKIFSYFH